MIIAILLGIFVITLMVCFGDTSTIKKKHSKTSKDQDAIPDALLRLVKSRRDYYRDVYLKSDAWQRKRYVVLKRDNWRCVYCGNSATQVHHTRYAKYNIGKEPIEWLVSICKACHDAKHPAILSKF